MPPMRSATPHMANDGMVAVKRVCTRYLYHDSLLKKTKKHDSILTRVLEYNVTSDITTTKKIDRIGR